jgi:glycosyltransferase involved in cell wall biosynthesis
LIEEKNLKMNLAKTALVSVIIPTYNVEKYIQEAIHSVQTQAYRNIEIIVVDDCSTDGTYDILQKLARLDSRIKLYRNTKNSKIVYSINKALSYSSGEYIARMDGDDIATPDKIEKQVQFLKDNPHIDLVGVSIVGIDEDGNILTKDKRISSLDVIQKTLLFSSPVGHSWLCKKTLYDKLGGYREIPGAEDYDFLLRMATENLLFINIDYYGYYLRKRQGNTMDSNGLKQLKQSNYVIKLYKERLKNQLDTFSIENLEKHTQSSDLMERLHRLSNKYLARAIFAKAKNKYVNMIFYLFCSALLSPYQIQYLYKRMMLRFILSLNRK